MAEQRIYLDHSATTPVDPEVVDTMRAVLAESFGNPSSVHSFGRKAKVIIEKAREKVAGLLGASPEEIYFTSGGTEADNWALRGIAGAMEAKGRHIITANTEHPAVIDTCRQLEKDGFRVTYLPTDKYGTVHPHDLAFAIGDETILVSLMQANNEIGTINPIRDYVKVCREAGVPLHCDMVQSYGKILTDVHALGVDIASVSSHKIYGPKGVGALYVRSGIKIEPIIFGGHQERNRRVGTENVPGIAGFGKAAELAAERVESDSIRLGEMADRFVAVLSDSLDEIQLNGHPKRRLSGHISITFKGIDGEALLMSLDTKGIAASAGAACTSGAVKASHVLAAIGLSPEDSLGTLRFTFGRGNSPEDALRVAEVVVSEVERLRKLAGTEEMTVS